MAVILLLLDLELSDAILFPPLGVHNRDREGIDARRQPLEIENTAPAGSRAACLVHVFRGHGVYAPAEDPLEAGLIQLLHGDIRGVGRTLVEPAHVIVERQLRAFLLWWN